MGVKGLRAALKESQLREGHIKEWAGQKIVCDGYAWLHKGAYACATQLAEGTETTLFLNYSVHIVKMMKHYGVTPIVVLDGSPLPGKAATNAGRREKRNEQMQKGKELQAQGDTLGAEKAFQGAVRVTTEMARKLQIALKKEGVACIVSPYEADAQMAYMVRQGDAAAAVTEDSDLIPYGVDTCLYKMDKYGNCTVLSAETLGNKSKSSLDISKMTLLQRIHMCILAGCDYLPSIEGIGVRKAFDMMRKYRDGYAVIRALRSLGKVTVPDGYEDDFKKAELTFKHHRVYDTSSKRVVTLSPIPPECTLTNDDLAALLGPHVEDDIACALCEDARIDPHTMMPFPKPKPRPQPSKPQQTNKRFAGGGGMTKSSGLMPYLDKYSDNGHKQSPAKGEEARGHKSAAKEGQRTSTSGATSMLWASKGGGARQAPGKEERKRRERPAGDIVSMIAASMFGPSRSSSTGRKACGDCDDEHNDDGAHHEAAKARQPQAKVSPPAFGVRKLFALPAGKDVVMDRDENDRDNPHHISDDDVECDVVVEPPLRLRPAAAEGEEGDALGGICEAAAKRRKLETSVGGKTPPTVKKAGGLIGALDAFVVRGKDAHKEMLNHEAASMSKSKSSKKMRGGSLDSFLIPAKLVQR